MSAQSTKRMPAPLYAAAGAGDLAYEKLRKLPERMSVLREKVHELRPNVKVPVPERDVRADLARLRAIARRNATALVNTAHAAQERAAVVYNDLVARGEHVVHAPRPGESESESAELTPAVALEIEPTTGEPAAAEAPADQASKE